MRIAILSAGPNVAAEWETRKAEQWDAVVGVSCAAWVVDVDWLCWMDGIVIRGMIERGRQPRIGCVWHVSDLRFWPGLQGEAYPRFECGQRAPTTLPNALMWARRKWPSAAIEIIGHEMSDEPNAGGLTHAHCPKRWADELRWMRRAFEETQ